MYLSAAPVWVSVLSTFHAVRRLLHAQASTGLLSLSCFWTGPDAPALVPLPPRASHKQQREPLRCLRGQRRGTRTKGTVTGSFADFLLELVLVSPAHQTGPRQPVRSPMTEPLRGRTWYLAASKEKSWCQRKKRNKTSRFPGTQNTSQRLCSTLCWVVTGEVGVLRNLPRTLVSVSQSQLSLNFNSWGVLGELKRPGSLREIQEARHQLAHFP